MFYFVWFCLSCLPLLVLILILYRYYLLWHPSKIESTHAGDRSLSPCLPAWSLARMMSVTLSMCPQALPPLPVLQVLPEPHPKRWRLVTASQSDEERTLTGTPSGSATIEEGVSGSTGVSWSEEAFGSTEVPALATAAASASSNEADSLESTSGSPAQVPTPATNQPNW